MHCLPNTGLPAPFSHPPREHPWLWNAPFLNHNHSDSNLKSLSITSTFPVFYLRPLEPSAHLFTYSLSDNSVPSMCQSLEIQPRISQTPSCTELTIGPSFLSLCQLPPTFSSLHILLPSLDPQPPLHHSLLLISRALCASLLPGRNHRWATHLPAFSVPAPAGTELEPQSDSLKLTQALISHPGNPPVWPSSSFFLLTDDECFRFSPQASNKLKSLPHKK